MFKSKYSSILTILLIVVIIGIIVVATILSAKAYKDYKEGKQREKQIAQFQEEVREENKDASEGEEIEEIEPIDIDLINNEGYNQNSNSSNRPRVKLYDNKYPMIGTIEIPKTKAKYPILTDTSPGALDAGVGIIYPGNPKLNEPGNTVIIGHNYRNGKMFSNNKKLVVGDTIKITDLNGKTLTYTIYEIFEAPETNTEYITRERGNNIEISLSTCTDDGKARLIILAKV